MESYIVFPLILISPPWWSVYVSRCGKFCYQTEAKLPAALYPLRNIRRNSWLHLDKRDTVAQWNVWAGRLGWTCFLGVLWFYLYFEQVDWCLLYPCFDFHNSAEEHHGCLVKEQRVVVGGSRLNHRSHLSVEQCAKFCADRSDCDAFHVERKVCHLFREGITLVHCCTIFHLRSGLWTFTQMALNGTCVGLHWIQCSPI